MRVAGQRTITAWPRRLRYVAAGAVVAVGTGLALSACGSTAASQPPSKAVNGSFNGLGDQSSISLSISLPISAQDLQTIAAGNNSKLSDQDAQRISHGSIFIDLQSGNSTDLKSANLANDSQAAFDIGVKADSTDVLGEVRYVNQNLYAKLDPSVIQSAGSKFQDDASAMNAAVPGISALFEGQWVEISRSSLESLLNLLNQYEGSSNGSAGSTASPPNSAQIDTAIGKLRTDLLAAYNNNAVSTDVGSTSNGSTHYQVTLKVQPFLQQASTALNKDLSSLPGASAITGQAGNSVGKIDSSIKPDQTAVVDVYVQNGKAQEVDIDLNQFEHKYSFAIPLRVVIEASQPIAAPSGSTPLDLSSLSSLLGGFAGKTGTGSNAGS